MTEADLRAQLAAAARRLHARGLAVAYEGNLSARWPTPPGTRRRGAPVMLCSPARRCKGDLEPRDFLRVDGGGLPLGPGTPTSERLLHLGIYRHLPEARAVVHAHPPCATAFACVEGGLAPPLVAELVLLLGGPVPVAPFAPPGSEELVAAVRPFLAASPVILLANHGVVAVSRESALDAVHLLDQVEQVARVTLLARLLGGARPLPPEILRSVLRPGP